MGLTNTSLNFVDNVNISGSSTSTGSFGAGYIDNKLGINTDAPQAALHINKVGSNSPILFNDGYYELIHYVI